MTGKKRDLALFGSIYSISRAAMKDSGAISESASPTQSARSTFQWEKRKFSNVLLRIVFQRYRSEAEMTLILLTSEGTQKKIDNLISPCCACRESDHFSAEVGGSTAAVRLFQWV